MQEELGQFTRNEVYDLVARPKDANINGTTKFELWYTHDSTASLMGYCDTVWTRNYDVRKSTLGECFLLGNNLVSWFNKKQNCISFSKAEAKYIVIDSSCSRLVWMINMKVYGVSQDDVSSSMTLYYDNISAFNFSKSPIQHSRSKHTIHHFIINMVEDKVIELKHIPIAQQLTYIFTYLHQRPQHIPI